MSIGVPAAGKALRHRTQREGIKLLIGIVALMWFVEAINWLDGYKLDHDGIVPRDFGRLWGIFTSPFIHANFAPHLLGNTIPLVFMGLIIAVQGARRLAMLTFIVILIGGIGTWLIAPSNTDTIGASGVVFGYATYLFARGLFNRSIIELLVGVVVGVVWGGALIASVVPHYGVSWQAHVCGAVGGVVAAGLMARERPARRRSADGQSQGLPAALS